MSNADKIFFDKVLDIVCEYYRLAPSEISLSTKKSTRAKMMITILLRNQGYAPKEIHYLAYGYISTIYQVYNYLSRAKRHVLDPNMRGTSIHGEYVYLRETMIDYAGIVA